MNYCERCGAALRETVRVVGFTSTEGRCRYEFRRRCPNKSRFFTTRHTDVRFVGLSRAEADKASDWEWHDS